MYRSHDLSAEGTKDEVSSYFSWYLKTFPFGLGLTWVQPTEHWKDIVHPVSTTGCNCPLHFSVVEQSNLRCVPNVVQIVWVGSTFLLFLTNIDLPLSSSLPWNFLRWLLLKTLRTFCSKLFEKLAIQFLKRTTLEWIKHFFTTGLCKSIKGLINSEPECQISVEVSKSCKNCTVGHTLEGPWWITASEFMYGLKHHMVKER